MTIKLDVRGDVREVQKLFKELGPGVQRAASRALNKTATAVRKEAVPRIRKQRALKAGVIRDALKIVRATYRRLTASIEASGKAIPIRHFGANLTKRGVTVRIAQGGKRTLLMRSGIRSFTNIGSKLGPNVFVRKGRSRLPISKWSPVPGIPTVFVQAKVTEALEAVARTVFPKRFREELNHELRKAAEKASRGS